MLKKVVCLTLLLQGCTSNPQPTQKALNPNSPSLRSSTDYSITSKTKALSSNFSQTKLKDALRSNIYRVSTINRDEDLWDFPPVNYQQDTFEQLTNQEQTVYTALETSYLNNWIMCNGKEYVSSSSGAPFYLFYEVMNYQARVEINTLPLNQQEQANQIQWKGNIRLGFYKSLARDVVINQKYTFLSEDPYQSLPNFRWYSHNSDFQLKDNQISHKDRQKIVDYEISPLKLNCDLVQKVLETTK